MTVKHLYPNSTPALNLNPKSSRVADPRLSCVRNSIGTYVDPVSGLIKTAPANVARVDKNGLMVEESRTNEVQFSEDYNATGWTRTGITSTINSGTAPDGTNTASLVQSTVNGPASLKYFVATTGATTLSAFVKAGTSHTIHLYLHDDQVKVDLSTETITAASSATIFATSIRDVGNGWYRCSMTSTRTGQTEKRVIVNNSDGSYQASIGDNVYVWGVQIEEGDSPTSYIPTSGSTVQRLADQITLTNSGIFNPNENTIINEDFGVAGGSDTLTVVGDGSKAERTFVYSSHLSQAEINAVADKTDDWWEWRVLGSTFGLPDFTTDGQVSVDWGDGTTVATLTTSDHTFTNGDGYHTIKFRLDSGTEFKPRLAYGTHSSKVVSIGPAPASMIVNLYESFRGCTNLETFDATCNIDSANAYRAWSNCSSLLSFPFIDTSNLEHAETAWSGCTSLTSFPALNFSGINTGTGLRYAWQTCSSLTSFPSITLGACTNLTQTWNGCSSLTSFPLIDTSNVTHFGSTWQNCSSLTSFPLVDTSSGTNFNYTWYGCNSLTSFPAIDLSSCTSISNTWRNCTSLTSFSAITGTSNLTSISQAWSNCSSLTSFPALNLSSATSLVRAWEHCSGLTSFPQITLGSCITMSHTWLNCNSLTTFPTLDISSVTSFTYAWQTCSGLTTWPANFFNSWTATPADNCFNQTWRYCSALTPASVENILVSIAAAGVNAPASGNEITIDYNGSGLTSNTTTAINTLKNTYGWAIRINNVLQ